MTRKLEILLAFLVTCLAFLAACISLAAIALCYKLEELADWLHSDG